MGYLNCMFANDYANQKNAKLSSEELEILELSPSKKELEDFS